MEIYQCKADGSNGHWEKLDLVMDGYWNRKV